MARSRTCHPLKYCSYIDADALPAALKIGQNVQLLVPPGKKKNSFHAFKTLHHDSHSLLGFFMPSHGIFCQRCLVHPERRLCKIKLNLFIKALWCESPFSQGGERGCEGVVRLMLRSLGTAGPWWQLLWPCEGGRR